MKHLLHFFYLWSLVAFAQPVKDLDDPDFAKRLEASKVMRRNVPWSLPAAYHAIWFNDSPESRVRCEFVIYEWHRTIERSKVERIYP